MARLNVRRTNPAGVSSRRVRARAGRTPHDGQNPRPPQENGTSRWCWHGRHTSQVKPRRGSPHRHQVQQRTDQDDTDTAQAALHKVRATHRCQGSYTKSVHRYAAGVRPVPSPAASDLGLSPVGKELLFYGNVFVLESFLGHLNQASMADDSLDVTTRHIHRLHYLDEARHIAFDKVVIREAVDQLRESGLDGELDVIADQLRQTELWALRSTVDHRAYIAAGVDDVGTVLSEVLELRRPLHERWMASPRQFLAGVGLNRDVETTKPSQVG